MIKRYYSIALLAVVTLLSINAPAETPKQIVGATEVVRIEEGNLSFKARVDTGAKTSSIHAERIDVDLPGDPRGKPIVFYLVNKSGHTSRVETRVDSLVNVRTSEGSELRYKVPLTVQWKGSTKTVLVTLNDRSRMQYALLLGRNWLLGEFIVDVSINDED